MRPLYMRMPAYPSHVTAGQIGKIVIIDHINNWTYNSRSRRIETVIVQRILCKLVHLSFLTSNSRYSSQPGEHSM